MTKRSSKDAAYVIWLGTLGMDRVDFLGGGGAFLLTPFLVIGSLIVVWELASATSKRAESAGSGPGLIIFLGLAMCGTATLSLLLTNQATANLPRLGLLFFQIGSSAFLCRRLLARPHPSVTLYRGARLGLVLSAISSLLQLQTWFAVGPEISKRYGFFESMSLGYGTFAPRLSGVSIDPNRGTLSLALYAGLLVMTAGVTKSSVRGTQWLVTVSLLLAIASFSRTGVLAWLVTVLWLIRRTPQGVVSLRRVILPVVVIWTATWLALSTYGTRPITWGPLLEERGNFASGSSGGVHQELVTRALDVVNQSFHNLIIGVGFGNSSVGLGDIFNGSQYGNFHSTYLGALVGMGLLGLTVVVALTVLSVVRGRDALPLAVALLLFNIGYETTLEPTAWFILTFCSLGALATSRSKPGEGQPVVVLAPAHRGLVPASR